jgi:hypothetical protein
MSTNSENEAFETWWASQGDLGLGASIKFAAWNAWLGRAALAAPREYDPRLETRNPAPHAAQPMVPTSPTVTVQVGG